GERAALWIVSLGQAAMGMQEGCPPPISTPDVWGSRADRLRNEKGPDQRSRGHRSTRAQGPVNDEADPVCKRRFGESVPNGPAWRSNLQSAVSSFDCRRDMRRPRRLATPTIERGNSTLKV